MSGCKSPESNESEQKVDKTEGILNSQSYSGIDQTDTTRMILNHEGYKLTGKVPHLSTHNGYSMSFYSNGKIASEGLEFNMKKNGIWIDYYPSGKIKSIISYWNDQPDGVVKLFYENGRIRKEGYHFRREPPVYKEEWGYDSEFKDSSGTTYLLNPDVYKHGTWNEYDSSGNLIQTEAYNMGILIESRHP